MKFGLLYLPTYVPELDGPVKTFYDRMLDQIVRADELGYETVWLTEHHFDYYGGTVPNPAVLGATVAHATQRIRIGTAITVLPLHDPLLVAEDFAMLDVLSDGRLDFGIGRGSVLAEFGQFGLPTDNTAEIADEATEVILKAWSQETFEHQGTHFKYPKPISLLPQPVQRPHPPVWVGASRTLSSFEKAGRNGFHIMVLPYMFPLEFTLERLDAYFTAALQAGHDVSKLEVMAKFHVFVADSAAEARRFAAPAYDHYQRISSNRSGKEHGIDYWRSGTGYDDHVRENKFIAGSPEDCIQQIRYWQEKLGLTHIGGTFHFGGLDQQATLRSIELFAKEVAPAFVGDAPQTAAAIVAAARG